MKFQDNDFSACLILLSHGVLLRIHMNLMYTQPGDLAFNIFSSLPLRFLLTKNHPDCLSARISRLKGFSIDFVASILTTCDVSVIMLSESWDCAWGMLGLKVIFCVWKNFWGHCLGMRVLGCMLLGALILTPFLLRDLLGVDSLRAVRL